MKLFVVESPAKARTINSYLGKGFIVVATMGHIKDLPDKEIGVDLYKLEPKYVILPGKRRIVSRLIELAKKCDAVILASDKDREGETISFHVKEVVSKYAKDIQRIEFTEITKEKILEALRSPRDVNYNLVDAQKTRRVLDRIVGYMLSPVLFKRLGRVFRGFSFSVGRVQSPALRLVCEREIEIKNFVSAPYYDVLIECRKNEKNFFLKLISEFRNGKEVKFSPENRIDKEKLEEIKSSLNLLKVRIISSRRYYERIKPLPPFKTSTLQQDASAKLGFSPSKTMRIAQGLYEGVEIGGEFIGLITYMRTDSVKVSEHALVRVREFIKTRIGEEYLPSSARMYCGEGREQGAHECIRPTDVFILPASLKGKLSGDYYKLYGLIWRRFLASQMKDAVVEVVEVLASDGRYNFLGVSKTVVERHFMDFYPHSVPEEVFIPPLEEGELLDVVGLNYRKKATQPPPRYTEATLIKRLEEEGIGRPSTYATILSTLLTRRYVVRKNRSLVPTELGFAVYEFLKSEYPAVIDLKLTSYMEEMLDKIENGEITDWKQVLVALLRKVEIPWDLGK